MVKIIQAETGKDIELVKMFFAEYADFLKKELCECADLPWLVQYYRDFEEETANLPEGYSQPEGCLLIARYKGEPAGCVALARQSEGVCEMKRLFVGPEYRRLGIGKALCEVLLEQAMKIGYSSMRLATALEPPKVLYKSLGFKEIAAFTDVPDEIKGIAFMELSLI